MVVITFFVVIQLVSAFVYFGISIKYDLTGSDSYELSRIAWTAHNFSTFILMLLIAYLVLNKNYN